MHRVELKVVKFVKNRFYYFINLFLMHRVELKVPFCLGFLTTLQGRFLMHRVELKDQPRKVEEGAERERVPNAPCGVERIYIRCQRVQRSPIVFLMHRVELKGFLTCKPPKRYSAFLMHRMELKVIYFISFGSWSCWRMSTF